MLHDYGSLQISFKFKIIACVRWCCLIFQTSYPQRLVFVLQRQFLFYIRVFCRLSCALIGCAFSFTKLKSVYKQRVHGSSRQSDLWFNATWSISCFPGVLHTLMSNTSRKIGLVHVRRPKMVKSSHRGEKNVGCDYTLISSLSMFLCKCSSNV